MDNYEDQPLLTYRKLAELISQMSPEDQAKPIVSQNNETGAYFGFTEIIRATNDDIDLPEGFPILKDDNNWLWYKNGEVCRNYYDPHTENGTFRSL